MMTDYDVVTVGETMLRLTPPQRKRIEQTGQFTVDVGGSESNTAVGLARLGLKVAWVSRLPANPLGRLVLGTLARHGVDTSHVTFADDGRLGLYFYEEGTPPRPGRVIYDRKHSAFSQIQPRHLPTDLFSLRGGRHLHLTGITPALSETAAATLRHAVGLAQAAAWTISFDLNYRGALWAPEDARRGCRPFARAADVLIAPRRDLHQVFGFDAGLPDEQLVEELVALYPQTTIVLTLGAGGALAYADGRLVAQEAADVDEGRGRVGGGDAFSAGFLYRWLSTAPGEPRLAESLRWGVAMAALKYTIPGDMPVVDEEEVRQLVAQLGADGPTGGSAAIRR